MVCQSTALLLFPATPTNRPGILSHVVWYSRCAPSPKITPPLSPNPLTARSGHGTSDPCRSPRTVEYGMCSSPQQDENRNNQETAACTGVPLSIAVLRWGYRTLPSRLRGRAFHNPLRSITSQPRKGIPVLHRGQLGGGSLPSTAQRSFRTSVCGRLPIGATMRPTQSAGSCPAVQISRRLPA